MTSPEEKKKDQGFVLLEAIISVGMMVFIILALTQAVAQKNNMVKEEILTARRSGLTRLIFENLDCEQTMNPTGASPSPSPPSVCSGSQVEVRNAAGQSAFIKDGDRYSALGYLIKATCDISRKTLVLQYAKPIGNGFASHPKDHRPMDFNHPDSYLIPHSRSLCGKYFDPEGPAAALVPLYKGCTGDPLYDISFESCAGGSIAGYMLKP